jgi:hypothetical protein
MKKIFLLILLTSFLLAQNPKIYSALGDVVYDNVDKISKLKKTASFTKYTEKINNYIIDVNKTKKIGFSTLLDDKNSDKSSYLSKLRELSKTNDFFIRNVKNNFKLAILNSDNALFTNMINSGLLDTKYFKKSIIDYYISHKNDINNSDIVQQCINEESKLIKIKKKQKIKKLQKEQIQKAKIRRIRAKDLAEHEAIKRTLEADVAKKKEAIFKKQKRELSD